jgi:hypothetical protein
VKPRVHLGRVGRRTRDGRLWFDALPASARVLFHVSRTATRLPGLGYDSIRARLPQANRRGDLVVSVRLHDPAQASTVAGIIAAATRETS